MTWELAQAGNRASKTRHYLQWWVNKSEQDAATSALQNLYHSTYLLLSVLDGAPAGRAFDTVCDQTVSFVGGSGPCNFRELGDGLQGISCMSCIFVWMAYPDQASSLQGSLGVSGDSLAVYDLGTGSGWQQSKQNWAPPAVVGK